MQVNPEGAGLWARPVVSLGNRRCVVKAVPVIALAVALVGSLFAAGAYYRVRTAGPAEVDSLKTRVAQIQKDLAQANDRMARLERSPQPSGPAHDHSSEAPSGDIA